MRVLHVALFCATRRGLRVFEELIALAPSAEVTVFSFREEAWEPPFLDAIKEFAGGVGARFVEARAVGSGKLAPLWESLTIDLAFAVNWRYLIPTAILSRPRLGAYVFHDSLLPRYRGFSPTVWAMVNGESHTGVTLCQMADAVDAGDIVDQEAYPIGPRATIADVFTGLTDVYVELFRRTYPRLAAGTAVLRPQDHTAATYTCKRLPEDNAISWSDSTARIYNLIRACTRPYPGAFTTFQGAPLRIWSALPPEADRRYVGRVPGRVVEVLPDGGVIVLTGDGCLQIGEVQQEGQAPVSASVLLGKVSSTLGR